MAGDSLVRRRYSRVFYVHTDLVAGNYDVTKMHYDGPGAVPGAPGGGYGYDVRTKSRFAVLSEPVAA